VNGTEDGFVYNKFSRAHNNAADILSKSDQRCALPLPGKSTHNYAAKCPQDNAQARTPMKDLLRDPYNFDFRPKTEQYPKGLLQGAKTNVPKFKTINGSNIDVSGGFDIGAYQDSSTTYWIPGKMFVQPSTPVPPHTTTTARADLDLMFLEGRGAAHHNVYFSQNPCQAWRARANGPQHIAQLSGSNIVHRNLLGDLQAATWYYWRVDAVAADGTVRRGPLWCFAVGAGEGGCSGPPCSQWEATIGQACVTDDGTENPIAPLECAETPPETSPPPTQATTTSIECKDHHWKCPTKWKNKCHKSNVASMCLLTCGKCTTGTTTLPPPETTMLPTETPSTTTTECKDHHWKCPNQWKNKCHKQVVAEKCLLTCGKCTIGMTTLAPILTTMEECKDKHGKCSNQWKNKCWKQSVRKTCPLTCGDCTV